MNPKFLGPWAAFFVAGIIASFMGLSLIFNLLASLLAATWTYYQFFSWEPIEVTPAVRWAGFVTLFIVLLGFAANLLSGLAFAAPISTAVLAGFAGSVLVKLVSSFFSSSN